MPGPSRGWLRAAAAVLAAIGLLLAAGHLWQPGLDRPATSPAGVPQPPAEQPTGPPWPLPDGVEFAQPISGLAVTPAAVWIAYGTTVARLDPRSLRATASLQVTAAAGDVLLGTVRPIRGLAVGGSGGPGTGPPENRGRGAIWATLADPGAGLLRIDPATARVVAAVPVPSVAPAAVSGSGVWVVCCGGETYLGPSQLVRVDPATNRVAARIPLPGLPDAVGAGPSGVWVRAAAGPIWRIDPATNRIAATVTVPHGLGGSQGSVLVGEDAVWVSDPATATVLQVDPVRNRIVARGSIAGRALAAAADGTVLATSRGRVLGLGRGLVRSVHLDQLDGAYTTALAAAGGTIWVAQSGMLLHVAQRGLR